ncbi:MAG TPA: methyltransferase domain-containing protein, partial [Usitatibacter sp.]|nr:methyltransferase domain-containing protein [Usitatibacter sp.]
MTEARARFAAAIAKAAGVDDPRVAAAFAQVPREDFVGPGPWLLLGPEGYIPTASTDPEILYDDVVVALAPDKRINNGQPTLHARCLSAARVRPGESVLHIGCGSGYYSAILSELATSEGTVDAWDIEPALVERATSNLAGWPNVAVSLRDALKAAIPHRDVIYVCAGLPYPVRPWAEALSPN